MAGTIFIWIFKTGIWNRRQQALATLHQAGSRREFFSIFNRERIRKGSFIRFTRALFLKFQIKMKTTVHVLLRASVSVCVCVCELAPIRLTRDCQNADPPTAASKYMLMMKICTSVTSMLGRREREREKKRNLQRGQRRPEASLGNTHTGPHAPI